MLTITPRVAPSVGGRLEKHMTVLTITPRATSNVGGRLEKHMC